MANDISDPTFLADLRDHVVGETVVFTGSREFPRHHQQVKIDQMLARLHNANGFVTGACIGIDHYVGLRLLRMYPDKHHTVVVPADRSRVVNWWAPYAAPPAPVGWSPPAGVEVIEMPAGTSYRDRNQRMIDLGSFLIGYPARTEFHDASRRSGSWQTVRMGRRSYRRQPAVVPLDAM